MIKVHVGCSIRSLLQDQLGFSKEYVDRRIQTFFLDGKAVDNIDSAFIHDNSTLALSASMPGLLGATLRKGSYYARMRSSISHNGEATVPEPHKGAVRLKLFNMLIQEMGPAILKHGVWVESKSLAELLASKLKKDWLECADIIRDGRKVAPSEAFTLNSEEKVFLRVEEI